LAQGRFTAEFGMGSGAATPVKSPGRQRSATNENWFFSFALAARAISRFRPSTMACCDVPRRVALGTECAAALDPRGQARSDKSWRISKRSGMTVGLSAERNNEHCLMRAIKSIEVLVPVSCTLCSASTPGLSTWWSTTALKGELVLRWVSRLDAFSVYPVHT
jgi:hypothetical protein